MQQLHLPFTTFLSQKLSMLLKSFSLKGEDDLILAKRFQTYLVPMCTGEGHIIMINMIHICKKYYSPRLYKTSSVLPILILLPCLASTGFSF